MPPSSASTSITKPGVASPKRTLRYLMRATHAFSGTLSLRRRHAGSAEQRTQRERNLASQCVHSTPQACGCHCGYPIRLSKLSLDLQQKAQIKGATPPEHKHWHGTDTYANERGNRQGLEMELGEVNSPPHRTLTTGRRLPDVRDRTTKKPQCPPLVHRGSLPSANAQTNHTTNYNTHFNKKHNAHSNGA